MFSGDPSAALRPALSNNSMTSALGLVIGASRGVSIAPSCRDGRMRL